MELTDRQVRRAVYDAFLTQAQPPSIEDLAHALDISIAVVVESYRRLAQGHVLVLQPESGEILMANPFSAVPTSFLVAAGSQEWWGNCVWDALGILAMLGVDGQVRTSCPDCGESLNLTVRDGALQEMSLVVHFSVPAHLWWQDIVHT
jgi:hypothetical protein